MKVAGLGYRVVYDSAAATVKFEGVLRLLGEAGYARIKQLLNDAVAGDPEAVTLDVSRLEFLNSQGMVLVTRFIMDLCDSGTTRVAVHGSARHRWQVRWLQNMERLVPEMRVDWEQAD